MDNSLNHEDDLPKELLSKTDWNDFEETRSLCTQYLYAPQIHFNLAGKPIAFIGNSSNKMGEFSLIKINITSIHLFPYINDKATMDNSPNHGDDLPKELLSKTDWNDFEEPIVGTLIPNFFITYFGQVLPHGDISDD